MSISTQTWAHHILRPPCGTMPSATPQEPERLIKIADSGAELLLAFSLLYQEYVRAGYTRPNQAELLFGRHHLLPETAVFLAKGPRTLLATATVTRDSDVCGLPMDDLFESELNGLRQQGRSIVEVCSLASDARSFPREGVQAFTRLLFLYCLALGVDDMCIMVNPRHVPLYRDRCRFEILGHERHYPRVNAPAVALRSDLRAIRASAQPACSHPTIGRQADSACRRGGCRLCGNIRRVLEGSPAAPRLNPVDGRLLGILHSEREDIMCSVPRPFLERAGMNIP